MEGLAFFVEVPSVEAPRATAVPGPAQTGPRHVPGAHGVLDRVSGAQQRQEVTVAQDPQQESFDPRIPEAPVEVSAIPVIRPAHAESDPVTSPVPAAPDAALDPVETDADTGMVEMSSEPVADSPLTQPPLSEPVATSVLAPAEGDGLVPAPQAVPDPDANALEALADAALYEPHLDESGFADAPFAVPGERSRGRRLPRPRLRRSPKPAADPSPDRVVYGEHMPTQTIALVERLGSSAYGRRMRSRLSARKTDQDAAVDARTTLDFALKLGETMFSFGASSMDVESSIIVVTQAFGIHEIEIDLTNQAISLNYAPDSSRGEVPYTLQRVVRSWSTNFAGLGLLHRLVEEIADGETTRAEAQRRLVEIRRTPKPFPAWSEVIMAGVFCGLFVPFIGGTWRGALVGMVSTWIVFWLKIKVEKRGLPEIFSTMLGSFLATTIALTLHAVNVGIDPSLVIAGGIMILLPSSRFVAAVQDAINGFPLTAAGRLTSALLGYMGLMGGIMIGVIGSEIAGLPTLDLAEAPTGSELPALVLVLLVACAAMSDSIVEQATWKALIASGLVASAAYGVWLLFDGIGTGPRLTPAIAAMAVGFLGRIAALRLGFPQIVVVLPSMLFLLPGLAIFRALYEFTVESGSTLLGVAGIFNATVVVAAIAGGVVFGDILARPLTDRIFVGSRPATGVGHVR